MKTEHKAVLLCLLAGAALWVADATVDHFVFHCGPFLDVLILDVTGEELADRTAVLLAFSGMGLGIGVFAAKRRRAEKQLQESENRYRHLFDAIPQAAFLADVHTGRILEANRYAETLLATNRDAIIGMHQTQLHPPGREAEYRRRFAEHVAHGHAADYDGEVVRQDGTLVPVNISASTLTVGGRDTILGLFSDMTDRRRVEKQIEDLARFPAESPEPVLRVAEGGEVLYANTPATPLLEALGSGDGKPAPERCRQAVQDALASGEPQQVEIEHDGRTYTFRVVPVADAGYADLYGVDVTEQRLAEAELRQAQKMEAVGQLAGGIAHDFNNQLTVILGYGNRLRERVAADTEAARMADDVVAAAERSADLTRQLLAFSRKQLLDPAVVDLNGILGRLEGPLQRMIGEDIRLATILDPLLPPVCVDPVQIQHAVINLATNARDAMPTGGRLTVETLAVCLDEPYVRDHPGARPGPHVCLRVSDTGEGMDAETAGRIFDPFFTTKPAGEGTGLGLAMVHGFVRQSGGHVTVESAPGAGTALGIYLPVAAKGAETAAAPEAPARAAAPRKGGATVLVVEDDAAVRGLIVAVLARAGYKALEVATPGEALERLGAGAVRADVLVSDVVMPGMSGLELAERVRAAHPGLPILFMTGYAESVLVARGELASGETLLRKPLDPEALTRAVDRLLARTK